MRRSLFVCVLAAAAVAGNLAASPQVARRARAQTAEPLAIAPSYVAQPVDSPEPVAGSAFGNGPMVNAGDLNGDGEDDLLVVQPGDGDGKVFAISGADGSLVYRLAAPDPSTAGNLARFGQYVGKLDDIGACAGGQPGEQCSLPAIGLPDGVPEVMVGAINVEVAEFTDLGRAYVFDGATGALIKRIDMPEADRLDLEAVPSRPKPQFARTVLSPASPYANPAHPNVAIGDMTNDLTPDIIVGASQYHETGPASNPTCTPGPCAGSGRAYLYSGAAIAGSDPAVVLDTPYMTIRNPMAQSDDPLAPPTTWIESFAHSLTPIGDVGRCSAALEPGARCPSASSTSSPDGIPDVVMSAHWTDFPEGYYDSGVAWLVDGATGTMLVRYDHPRPQRGALWSFTLGNQPALGDVGGNLLPDVLLPSYAQHVQYAGQGQGYVMNGDFKARGDLVTLAVVDDPTPEPGGNFAVSIAGIGNVADDPRNEVLIGAWGPVTPGDDQTIVNDVHIYSPLRQRILFSVHSPDRQAGAGFGTGVAPLGDVNDDGYVDFAVGEAFYSGTLQRQGRLYIFRSTTAPAEAEREVTLRLRRHLRASGVVSVNGPAECAAGVPVVITRNGRTVKEVTTDATGAYRTRLADRQGTYRARATEVELDDVTCLEAISPKRRHSH